MSAIEIIGFVITLGALVIIWMRDAYLVAQRRKMDPEEYAKMQEEKERAVKEFLRQMDRDLGIEVEEPEEEEEPAPPPPPPIQPPERHRHVYSDWEYHSRLDDYQKKSRIEQRRYQSSIADQRYTRLGKGVVSEEIARGASDAYAFQTSKPARIRQRIRSLPKLADMVIYQEVFSAPKALRDDWDHFDRMR